MAFPKLDLTPGPDLPGLDLVATYRGARRRISELVRRLSQDELQRAVPASPDWSVRDVVAHQAGVAADVVAGNVDDAPEDHWTAAQVAARRDTPVEDLLREWEENARQIEPLIPHAPEPFTYMVVDTASHENDVLAATGRPVRRDDPVSAAFAARLVRVATPKIDEAGAAPLAIHAGAGAWVAGTGPPGGSLRVPDAFELVRASLGRRSVSQIRGWEWDADADRYIPLLTVFEPRSTPLVE